MGVGEIQRRLALAKRWDDDEMIAWTVFLGYRPRDYFDLARIKIQLALLLDREKHVHSQDCLCTHAKLDRRA